MAILVIKVENSNDPRSKIQDGWWPAKLLLIAGMVVGSFFIPNEVFIVCGWIFLFGAAGFILIQIVLLIDFAYLWAESWLSNYEKEEGFVWYCLLLACSVAMYLGGLALTLVVWILFYKGSECWMNIVWPVVNVLICLFFSVLSIHPKIQAAHKKGTGLLQSAVCTLYCCYLIFSAASSEPTTDDFNCNPFESKHQSIIALVIGAIFTIIVVCFSATQSASQGNEFIGEDNKLILEDDPKTKKQDAINTIEDSGDFDDEVKAVTYNYTFFHITFMLGAMYVAMLISNWEMIKTSEDDLSVDNSFASVWVKFASSWLVALLYTWTLIAPLVLQGREFH